MHDLRDHDGLSRETFLCRMAKALANVADINSAPQRVEAYCRAGFYDHDIIAHDAECKRREVIRRSIQGMKDAAQCPKVSQSA